jgi:hypothetical protein
MPILMPNFTSPACGPHDHEKTLRFGGLSPERLMGLEPTTFCMASPSGLLPRLAAFLKRHGYTGRKPARELLARLRGGAEGWTGELEMQARRQLVLALVSALEPIVARISELTIEIRHALDQHPDGQTFRSLFIAQDSWLCNDARRDRRLPRALPHLPGAGRRRRPSPRRRRIRQVKTRPIPLGLRPPATRGVLHPL